MTINLIQPAIEGHKVTSVWQRSSRYIVCLFCELRTRQVNDSPLCSNCLLDPVQTRTAIYIQQHGLEKREAAADAEWTAFVEQHPAQWATLCAAMEAPDYAERCERARKAGNIYGQLLERFAAYNQARRQLGEERDRLERALEALDETM